MIFMVRKTTAIDATPPPPASPPVKPFTRSLSAAGIVESLRENTSVAAPATSLVQAVSVKVWDEVRKGAPLFQLDDRELRAQLVTQRADLQVRQAELAKARQLHERAERLRTEGGVSLEEADSRHDELAIAKARVDAAAAVVAQTQVLIERLLVRAPADGVVLQINTRAGEAVSPGSSTPPMLLGAIREMQVRADVDEQVAPRVRTGSRAVGFLKGDTRNPIAMEFVRIEPYVVPKRSLTGGSTERVDTRVLQVIYRFPAEMRRPVYVGQQIDVFIEEAGL